MNTGTHLNKLSKADTNVISTENERPKFIFHFHVAHKRPKLHTNEQHVLSSAPKISLLKFYIVKNHETLDGSCEFP